MLDINDFDFTQFTGEHFNQFNDNVCKILMVGVGGAGCNAVLRLMGNEIHSTEFVAVNTDVQALCKVAMEAKKQDVRMPVKLLQIGKESTRGLGAGARPEMGKAAAEESTEDIRAMLQDVQLCFIVAGMGGGTGTGAAPVIAHIAKELGILTVAVVTKPFEFEGKPRWDNAEKGIEELKDNVDTLIVIPNDKLDKKSISNAFAQADDVLLHSIKGIGDLISQPLLINLDFADICTIMRDKGYAHIGIGSAKGPGRAVDAVRQAVNNTLTDTTIYHATGMIINYQAGVDFEVDEIRDATNLVRDVLEDNANIIFGVNIVPELGDRLDVVVIATGFQAMRQPARGGQTESNEQAAPQQTQNRAGFNPLTAQNGGNANASTVNGFGDKPRNVGGVPSFVNRLKNIPDDD